MSDSNQQEEDLERKYQIKPNPKEKLNIGLIKDIIKGVQMRGLPKEVKFHERMSAICLKISADIVDEIKKMEFSDRYKIFCQSVLGENHDQGVKIGAKCVQDWNTDGII